MEEAQSDGDVEIDFDSDYRFSSGLVASVSEPNIFHPSANAYPETSQAASFDILLVNDSESSYRLSDLSVKATIDGDPTEQVKDATLGYNGIVDADSDLGTGERNRFKLAFATDGEPDSIQVMLQPESATDERVVFRGPL